MEVLFAFNGPVSPIDLMRYVPELSDDTVAELLEFGASGLYVLSKPKQAEPMVETKKEYFVVSDGDVPAKLCFSLDDAENAGYRYIDVFDETGSRTTGYEWDHDAGDYI